MTIEPVVLETFRKNNEDFDVMGVIRTLYPNVDVKFLESSIFKEEKQNEMV